MNCEADAFRSRCQIPAAANIGSARRSLRTSAGSAAVTVPSSAGSQSQRVRGAAPASRPSGDVPVRNMPPGAKQPRASG
jgi:hypothetical protein